MPTKGGRMYKNNLYYYREAERLFLDIAKAGPYRIIVYDANYTGVISVKDPDLWFYIYTP